VASKLRPEEVQSHLEEAADTARQYGRTFYGEAFNARVKQARQAAGFSGDEMARLLQVAPGTYRRYEGRRTNQSPTLLPHHLMDPFCTITKVRVEWLLTGKGKPGRKS
jgi:transcriptional regulator with XRE-family HTH domain